MNTTPDALGLGGGRPHGDPGERPSQPDDEPIREAIAGNICRCTGYQQIVDAIEAAARELRAAGEPTA